MAIAEKVSKSTKITVPSSMKPVSKLTDPDHDDRSSDNSTTSPSTSHSLHVAKSRQSSLNYSTGTSAECLTALVMNEQLMEASERIWKEKTNGEDLAT